MYLDCRFKLPADGYNEYNQLLRVMRNIHFCPILHSETAGGEEPTPMSDEWERNKHVVVNCCCYLATDLRWHSLFSHIWILFSNRRNKHATNSWCHKSICHTCTSVSGENKCFITHMGAAKDSECMCPNSVAASFGQCLSRLWRPCPSGTVEAAKAELKWDGLVFRSFLWLASQACPALIYVA